MFSTLRALKQVSRLQCSLLYVCQLYKLNDCILVNLSRQHPPTRSGIKWKLFSIPAITVSNFCNTVSFVSRELRWAVYDEPRQRLRSASSQRLIVRRTRLRTGRRPCLRRCRSSPLEQPTSRYCHFTVAGKFHGTDKIFLSKQSHHWHIFVTCLCSHLQ